MDKKEFDVFILLIDCLKVGLGELRVMEIQILYASVKYIINSHSEKETLILFNECLLISAYLLHTVCNTLVSKPLTVREGIHPFEQQIVISLYCELMPQKPVLALQVITGFEPLPHLGF